jgi:glycosyltransferase involved in cell wall biosynthesis
VLPRFEPGSVFFDLDASWNVQSAARFDLLPRLAADGVRIAWFVHDLLPERHPEWFDPGLVSIFRSHLRAHADLADVFICNSRHTNDDLLAFVSDRHPDRTPTSVVVPLGGDPITSFVDSHRPATSAARIPPGVPVVLTVGTIEPRKGHVDLLDAWERIRIEVPDAHLVVVGRTGWHAEEIIARLTRHPDCGSRLHWLTDVDDDNLDNLYRCADLVVVPSLAEGYGLPVVEALTRDCAVVTSNGGALAEVGGDAVIRVPASDSALLADAVVDLFADPERRQQLMDAAAAWEAPSWADTARAVAAALGAGATAPESVTTGSP